MAAWTMDIVDNLSYLLACKLHLLFGRLFNSIYKILVKYWYHLKGLCLVFGTWRFYNLKIIFLKLKVNLFH